jgi:hypothetical protein
MGLSLGGSTSSGSSNSTTSNNGTTATTYSQGQSSLQSQLMQAFSSMLPGVSNGGLSPNVQNMETANANQINQNYSTVGDQMNRYLAARGFGKSGSVGKAAEQTELSRQGALGTNASNASGQQLSFDQSLLTDSLAAAFAGMGSSTSNNGTSSGSSSGSNFGWGVSTGSGG